MTMFEDRSGYNPDVDPVATITLDVECAPGQVDSIKAFLADVAKQAGVYSAAIGVDVHYPEVTIQVETEPAPAVEEPIGSVIPELTVAAEPEAVELVPPPAATPIDLEVAAAEPKTEGEADAEPELQQAGEPAEASPVERSEAAAVVGEDAGHAGGVDGELAGAAGEGESGSVGGSG